jgi:hypothetical protein
MSASFDPKFIHFSTASSSTLISGLLAGWKFEESSGDAIDVVSGVHLVPTGAISYSQTGKVGNCFGYNGSSRLSTAAPIMESASAFSVAIWFKSSTTGTVMALISNRNGSAGWDLHIEADRCELYLGSTYDHPFEWTVTNGVWHCVVFTYDGVNVQPYFDNTKETSYAYTYSQSPSALMFGWDGSYYFTGNLDESYIWNRCLSDTEVAALWNSGSGKSYPF